MIDARVGRLLAASLHQAIADELPQRLEFYEGWLRGQGMRDGTIGLAPITGVLGFLRTEGDAYHRVVSRAGCLAADWSLAGLSPLRRRVIVALPRAWRAYAALDIVRAIARDVCSTTRAATRLRRGVATMSVRDSPFCLVREPQARPLCGFYAALGAETLRQLGLPAEGRAESCRSSGASSCGMVLELR
jgi:hypothetical protein